MKIAVDIDGVLSKTFEGYKKELDKRGYDTSGPAESFDYWETDMLFPNVDIQTVLDMYEENWYDMRSSYAQVPGANTILHLLSDHELVAVTNRKRFSNQDPCPATLAWFDTHNIPISEIIHTDDKQAVLTALGCDVLIEDASKNALPVAQSDIPVLLIDRIYNRHIDHENIYRFSHWLEVPRLLTQLQVRQ